MLGIDLVLGFIPHKHKKAPTAPDITSYTITSKVRKRAVSPSMSTFYVGGKPIPETLFGFIDQVWGHALCLRCKGD